MYPDTQGQSGIDARMQASAQYQDQTTATLKNPSVVEQLNMQEKVIVGAHAALDALIDRIGVILGPSNGAEKSAQGPQPTPNNLSQRIPLHTRGIEALIQRMHELQGRIEL